MREKAQVLILPTDDGASLFNSAQSRRKTRRQFAINRWRHTRLPPEWISPPYHSSCAFLMLSSASRVSPFGSRRTPHGVWTPIFRNLSIFEQSPGGPQSYSASRCEGTRPYGRLSSGGAAVHL